MPEQDVDANIVRARQFDLVDDQGETLAILGSAQDGSWGLEILGDDQIPRATIGLNSERRARMDLRDSTGMMRVRLAVDAEGTPATFSIRNAAERVTAQVTMYEDEPVAIILTDSMGDPKAQVAVHPDGYAAITVDDDQGRTQGFSNR